jgi:hypothetical protein
VLKTFKKQKIKNIEFWPAIEGLTGISEIQPRLMTQMKPDWWKSLNLNFTIGEIGNARNCPSFQDVFSTAYVIPMWSDTRILVEGENITINTASNNFHWESHENSQFLDNAPINIKSSAQVVLKAICPWYMKTSDGYSSYQMPMFYDFNEDFSVLPGIIDTDRHYEINQQVLVHTLKKEFIIKRGDPFVSYFPFKREKFNLSVREQSKEDSFLLNKSKLSYQTKFHNGYRIGKKCQDL